MKTRSLWPREHGAYVQLLAPLAAALAVAPSIAGGLLAAGACTAFLAHEPWLVLRGARGRRVLTEDGARARRRVAACLALSGGLAIAGLAMAPHALVLAGAVGVVSGLVVFLSWRDEAHTLGGEIAAATALAGAAAPVAVTGGLPEAHALADWAMWSLAFASTVVAVHVVVVSHKRRATTRRALLWIALLAATGAGLALGAVANLRFLSASPLWLAAAVVSLARPPATRLRRVGVILAVMATLAAGALVTGELA
jgi:hypothetical protein